MLAAMTTNHADGTPAETVVRPWVRPGPVRTACLVMGSAGAAAIHFAVIPAHAAESTVLAVGFAVVAWLQAGFAVGALVRPSRGLVLSGAVLNLAALSVWGWSRLFGLPFGIVGGEIEPVAAVDALCAALELAVVVAAIWPARAGVARRATPAIVAVAGVAGLLVIGATSAVLAAASTHEHSHDEAQGEAHEHHHATEAGPTVQHAGAGAHEHAECTTPVTRVQQTAADELVAATRATLAQYTSFDAAVADGFVHITPEGQRVVHYGRRDRASDGRVLDPRAPEVLVYAFPPRLSPVLLGAMYVMEGSAEPPTPGGCLTQWHDHTNLCLAPGQGMVAFTGPDGSCPPGSSNTTTRAMMHVWRYDTSAGPFAELSELPVDELRAAIITDRSA
jgi:hypothetical protein